MYAGSGNPRYRFFEHFTHFSSIVRSFFRPFLKPVFTIFQSLFIHFFLPFSPFFCKNFLIHFTCNLSIAFPTTYSSILRLFFRSLIRPLFQSFSSHFSNLLSLIFSTFIPPNFNQFLIHFSTSLFFIFSTSNSINSPSILCTVFHPFFKHFFTHPFYTNFFFNTPIPFR